jgi:hypothetical protein
MTSENIRAMDLVTVPHIINVRLLKVMTFGEQVKVNHFSSVGDLTSLHRTDWAATAQWELDGHPRQLPPSEEHPQFHWCIKLNGKLRQEKGITLDRSFRLPNYTLRVRSFDLGGDLAPSDVFHSTLCVSSHSV